MQKGKIKNEFMLKQLQFLCCVILPCKAGLCTMLCLAAHPIWSCNSKIESCWK